MHFYAVEIAFRIESSIMCDRIQFQIHKNNLHDKKNFLWYTQVLVDLTAIDQFKTFSL